MELISKIKIKTSSTNIKELYIGFSQDNILHLVKLYKCDDIYQGKLYFKYEKNYSIYFKIIVIDNGSNHGNPFTDKNNEPIQLQTNEFTLENYQTTYNLEINEKKESVDEWYYDDYFYEYTIKII